MQQIHLFNTLTRKIQLFKPIDPQGPVRLYCCGPTVYNYAHIGNFRTYIFEDLLVRVLKTAGWQVMHVMNVTDIGHLTGDGDDGEDKMLKSARERQTTVLQIAEMFTKKFFEDAQKLNLLKPNIICRATDHIVEMIALIKKMEQAGFTYQAGGNLYFDTVKYAQYGELRGYGTKEYTGHHRVEVDQHKHHSEDFVLWFTRSKSEDQALHWSSPWGEGYPGWHLECSAMSIKYLGQHFDIHCGGIDHVSVHHTNEIAQNYASCGCVGANFWLHSEFLTLNQEKMSKSGGSFLTVDRLHELGFHPLDYRYLCLGTHYRKPLAFHDEAIFAAKQARQKLQNKAAELKKQLPEEDIVSILSSEVKNYWQSFLAKVSYDLNTPEGLAVLWTLLKDPQLSEKEKAYLMSRIDVVLGLELFTQDRAVYDDTLEESLMLLIQQRKQARKDKNYQEADRLRALLQEKGILIEDSPQGTIWKRKGQ